MIKKCLVCNIDFKVIPSMFERRKFCSKQCMAKDFVGRDGNHVKNKIQKKCLFCEGVFLVPPSLQNRKFCCKICADSYTSNGITSICQKCGKIFNVPPSRKETAKFCSMECKMIRIEKKCPICSISFLVIPSYKHRVFCSQKCNFQNNKPNLVEANKGRKPNENQNKALEKGRGWGKGLTKETNLQIAKRAKKTSQRLKGKVPVQFKKQWEFNKTSEGRKLNSERAKKYYAENPTKHINFILGQKGFESTLEKKMRLALESKQISFEKQFKIDKFWADFAILSPLLVIEVDGEHWHKDKEKDAKRDEIIKSYGWQVIRFSGKEIIKNIDCCVAKIEKIISSHQSLSEY